MLKMMLHGRYIKGSSIIHRADPRTKLALTLTFITVALTTRQYSSLLLMLLFTIALAQGVGRPLGDSLRGLRPIIYLALFTTTAHLFFDSGPSLAENGILSLISKEGAERSLKMILRLTVIVSTTSLLTCTTTPLTLMDGLQWMLKPLARLGLPVAEMATMTSLSLRFIPLIAEETEQLIKRTPEFMNGTLFQRTRQCGPLLMPLFAGVVRRGDLMATAMDARCFGAHQMRTRMCPLKFSVADISCAVIMLAFLVVLSYLEHCISR